MPKPCSMTGAISGYGGAMASPALSLVCGRSRGVGVGCDTHAHSGRSMA
jgi:hypothetical protein